MHEAGANGGRRRFVEGAGAGKSSRTTRARAVLISLTSSSAMVFAWACGGHEARPNEVASPKADSSPPADDSSGLDEGPSSPDESWGDGGRYAAGCTTDAASGEGALVAAYDASACGDVATIDAGACPTDKIVFRMCNACFNDGFIELCVNDGDDATLCAIRAIAPDTSVLAGSKGRIACSDRQRLVLIPVDKKECSGPNRWTANDVLWSRICAIASLAGVEQIAPTFFE